MLPERDQFESLLESVADGEDLDWAALDAAAATSAERRRYGNLRLVARVAEMHRTLVLEEEEEDQVPATLDADAVPADPVTWGHLSISSRLASGAFGQIYRAHDPQLNRPVALKLLRRDVTLFRPVDRLLGEARTLAQVRHSNVVTVHGADVREGRAGLWMELVDGETLESRLSTHGPMGAGEISPIGIDLCQALAAVHGQGLVHGDVKAQNVMREKGGRIVLMDFGAGRTQGADVVGVAGTPMYVAPEVLAGAPPTPQSDLYSLGILLFHLLTGKFPYSAVDLDGLRAAHADGARTWLRDLRPDLPHALVQTIERAIDPDPARRFATAGAMERALHPDAVRPVDRQSARERVRRVHPGFALAAVALLAVVVGLVAWSRRAVTPSESTAIRSIAVLPMADLSPQPTGYLADGLHDELIATLGQIQSLRVTSRSSVMKFKGSAVSAGEAARMLGVDAVLESTVSYTGVGSSGDSGHVRVNASLLMAGATTPEWSKVFEKPFSDLASLQGDLARAIAATIRAKVTPEESARLNRSRQRNPAAEDAYFQGRKQLEQYGSDRSKRAIDAFERAAALDPQYALAYVGAARAYFNLGSGGDLKQTEARALAAAQLRKAQDIDADLPEVRATSADIKFYYDWDWEGAEADYKRALEVNPSYTYARRRYAGLLSAARRHDEAVEQMALAETLDPLAVEAVVDHGMTLYYRRDYSAARAILDRAVQIEPGSTRALIMLGRIDEAESRFDEALQVTSVALGQIGMDKGTIPLRVQAIRLKALAGQTAEAQQAFNELRRRAEEARLTIPSQHLAYLQIALGNLDQGMSLLEEAAGDRDPGLLWVAVDPRVDRVRPMPRFSALLARLGLPEARALQH